MDSITCKVCKENKSLDAFYLDKRGNRYWTTCKACKNVYKSKWRKLNRDKENATKRRYRLKYLDKVREADRHKYKEKNGREKMKAWVKKNRLKVRETKKREYQRHKTSYKVRAKKWKLANLEAVKAWQKAYAEKKRLVTRARNALDRSQKTLQKTRNWFKNNPERSKQLWDNARKRHTPPPGFQLEACKQRLSMFPGCAYCGGPKQALDHVIPLSRGGTWQLVNLRPACKDCNRKKNRQTPFEWFGKLLTMEWVRLKRLTSASNSNKVAIK